MRTLRAGALMLALSVAVTQAAAQTRPIVLVHGFASSPATWNAMYANLQLSGLYVPYRPSMNWQAFIANQGSDLAQYLVNNGLGSNTVLIGHSMGGLSSRSASHIRPVTGIITIGTPHSGAPIAASFNNLNDQITHVWLDYMGVHNILDGFVISAPWDDPLYEPALDALDDIDFSYPLWELASAAAYGLQYWAQNSLSDLSGASGWITSLNNSVGGELVSGPRFSIEAQLVDGYLGGPLIFREPTGQANQDGANINLYAAFAGLDALDFVLNTEETQLGLFDVAVVASALSDYASRLANFSDWWTYSMVGGYPNDGIVPTTRQHYPSASPVPFLGMHTEETTTGVPTIRSTLDRFFHP